MTGYSTQTRTRTQPERDAGRKREPSREDYRRRLWADAAHHNVVERQLHLWVWYSHRSGYFSVGADRQAVILDAEAREVASGAVRILRSGLFRYDRAKHRYLRCYDPGETPLQFEQRARRWKGLRPTFAVTWLLSAMLPDAKGMAPHSNRQFAEDLDIHVVTATRALQTVCDDGWHLFTRLGGGLGRSDRSMYTRPERHNGSVRRHGDPW